MNLLSVVASLIEGQFAQFYNQLMPMMIQILNNVPMTNMTQMTLRSRTIEAMGFMIEAVQEQKDTFKDSVSEIAKMLVSLLTSGLTNDDPQSLSIKETLTKIASFLKEDFHAYMPLLLNNLVNDAKLDIDIKLSSADDEKTESAASFTFKMKGLEGNQRLSMNTSALESKIAAFKLFNMISESMGTAFAPYVEPLLPIMVENINYTYSKGVRKAAMKTLNNMLTAVGEPQNVTLFMSLYNNFITMITKSLEREDLKELKTVLKHYWMMIKNLNDSNKHNKNYFTEEQLNTLGSHLNKVLTLVSNAKKNTLAALGNKNIEMDEEDEETFKETLAKISAASTYVMEISGQLVLNFKEAVANMVKSNFLNFFALNLNSYKQLSESELLDATCFFCDFVEYSYHTDVPMMTELNNKFLEIFNSTDSMDVKQTLSYGMGVFALYIPAANYSAALPNVTKALNSMISGAEAFSEDNVVATESALGALGKLIYTQRENSIITDAVVNTFLSHLPLTHEEEEAQKTHKLFFEQVLANNPNLMSEGTKANVMTAIAKIREAAVHNENDLSLVDEEGMVLLNKLQ